MTSSELIRVRVLRGGYFALLGTTVSVVGSFTVSVILARLLGSEGLGVYTIYGVLGVVLIPLLGLSIPSAVTRYTSQLRTKDPTRLAQVLTTALLVLLAVGVFGMAFVFWLVAPLAGTVYGAPVLVPMLGIMGIALLANMLSLFASAVLQGLEEFPAANLVGGFTTLATVALLLALVPGFGLVGAAIAGAGSVLVSTVTTWSAVSRISPRHGLVWRWTYSWQEARGLLAFVGPLNAASMVSRASALVQNSLVALYIGFLDLGYFRIAGVFYGAILLLPRVLLSPMLPILSSMVVTRSDERRREILTQLTKMAILLVIPISCALILALPSAIDILYGASFRPALPLAVVMTVVAALTFPVSLLGDQYLVATGRTMASLAVTVGSVGVALALIVFLLPTLSTMSLPIAALVSEGVLFAVILGWLGTRREIGLRSLAPTLGFLGAATLGAVSLFLLLSPWAALAASVVLFGTLAAVGFYGFMTALERQLLIETVRNGLRGGRSPNG